MTSFSSLPDILRRSFRPIVPTCLVAAAIVTQVHAQTVAPPYVFRHLAGTPGGPGKVDGPRAMARFNHATGVAADSAGNVYVADSQNETIRKISPAGIVTTFAGSASLAGSTDGTGAAARFDYPTGPGIDASGNLFVADWANDTIRKVTPAGVVSTVAGTPYPGGADHGNADGVGSAARFWAPSSVAVDVAGNLFVADSGNHAIRKIAPDATVTTVAFASNSPAWPAVGFYPFFIFGGDKYGFGWGLQYSTGYLSQIAVDRSGNLYFGNYEWSEIDPPYYLVLKVDPFGVVTRVSQFPALTSLAGPALDGTGNLFIGSGSGLLRLEAAGTVKNVTGSTLGVSGAGLTLTPTGDCIVADYEQILKITPAGAVSIFAGLSATSGSADGTGPSALFDTPSGIAVDANGNCYVADTYNNTIRKITPAGIVTTLAGKAGVPGNADGTGPAAQFNGPSCIATDSLGNVYVGDGFPRTIRKITAGGVVTTLAGVGTSNGLAVDGANNIYFTGDAPDPSAPLGITTRISKLTPAGEVSLVASVGPIGIGSTIQGLAVDRAGNLYCVQSFERVIRKIDVNGNVTVFAGSGIRGRVDGPGVSAQFDTPEGLAVDGAGNVVVTDGNSIRRITPDGVVSTLGGSTTSIGSEDGVGAEAQFNAPAAVAFDSAGRIYIADTRNHALRVGEPGGAPVITTQPQNQAVSAGSSVQLSVTASGVPAPTYQWYFKGGAFSGATTNTLSFTNAQATDAGDYTVVVSNALGSVTSSKATLTVAASPVTPPSSPGSGGGGGGGGAIEPWFLAVLLVLIAAKHRAIDRCCR